NLDAGLPGAGHGVWIRRAESDGTPGRLARHAVAVDVPGHRLLCEPGLGLSGDVDGQLVAAGLHRHRWLCGATLPAQALKRAAEKNKTRRKAGLSKAGEG